MSTEQLKADLKESLATVKAMDPTTTTAADLVRHLKDTLWPTIEAVIDEIEDIDGSVEELADTLDGESEYLSEATGAVFAGIIAAGLAIAGEAEKLALPDPLKQAIGEFRQLCRQGAEKLNEIVIPDPDDVDEGDEDDDADDDEEDNDHE